MMLGIWVWRVRSPCVCFAIVLVHAVACQRAGTEKSSAPTIASEKATERGSPPTPSAPGSAAAAASAAPSAVPPSAPCRIEMEDRLSFNECVSPPRVTSTPDCYSYEIGPLVSDSGDIGPSCLPGKATLSMGGGDGDYWSYTVEGFVSEKPARPNHFSVELKFVEEQGKHVNNADDTPPPRDSVVATIEYVDGKATRMKFGPGMKSRTGVKSMEAVR